MKNTNWAIIAPGNIAEKFATALQAVNGAHCYSVASRNIQRAQKFADQFGFEKVGESYQALISDPKVDAVYIASPHMLHAEQSISCLNAGKAVLCEKPMTVNSQEARKVIEAARQNNTFFMEAVWTRFMPIHRKVREWISQGQIGETEMLQASFGVAMNYGPEHRIFNSELAGGALLDLGIYPITMAQIAFAEAPSKISALAEIGVTGVDENLGMVLHYSQGQIATLNASVRATTSCDAWIFGSAGRIHLPLFWCAEVATLYKNDDTTPREVEKHQHAHAVNGYEYEIEEVQRCLNTGLLESPLLPWNESLTTMKIMDEVRSQIGLKYPFEA